ncbi:hypothetical protein SMSK597_0548 [Streptococcus mitis SK597]|uniref:Uncharacterized protein n=1 Tax=Streptococcus mitis SK597 TaxID=585204 RepID=E1LRF0_STRMT|nr:hypothetical protein SMSK597_0548 [Streptococcus mitis SK597]
MIFKTSLQIYFCSKNKIGSFFKLKSTPYFLLKNTKVI